MKKIQNKNQEKKFLILRRSWSRGRRIGMRVWLQCIERRLSRSHLGYCLMTSCPDTHTHTHTRIHRGARTSLTQWWSVRGSCVRFSRWPAESDVHSPWRPRGRSIVYNGSSAQRLRVHSPSSESRPLVEQHVGVTAANLAGGHWRDSGRRSPHLIFVDHQICNLLYVECHAICQSLGEWNHEKGVKTIWQKIVRIFFILYSIKLAKYNPIIQPI